MIITRTPLRISLAGGGSDMPEFYKDHIGTVVSFAINKYVYVSVNKKFDGRVRVSYSKTEDALYAADLDHDLARETLKAFNIKNGYEITSVSDIPGQGSGLGSSSSFTVGLIKALSAEILSPSALAERAFYVERNMCGHPVGKQDQYAAAFGGFHYFRFSGKEVFASRISKTWNPLSIEENLLLLWTGKTRSANEILKNQSVKTLENPGLARSMADLAERLHLSTALPFSPGYIGEILNHAWQIKRKMAVGVTTFEVDDLYKKAMKAGAYGGKLCGAGGGGFMLFVAPPHLHERISRATGLHPVPFKISQTGSEVIYASS